MPQENKSVWMGARGAVYLFSGPLWYAKSPLGRLGLQNFPFAPLTPVLGFRLVKERGYLVLEKISTTYCAKHALDMDLLEDEGKKWSNTNQMKIWLEPFSFRQGGDSRWLQVNECQKVKTGRWKPCFDSNVGTSLSMFLLECWLIR